MVSKRERLAGITAISMILITLGALLCGAAFLALCTDIPRLASAEGLRYELIMLAMIFMGGLFAGIGIVLYEGSAWARPAAMGALAFVATLQVFGIASRGLPQAISYEEALLAITATSVLYLSLPKIQKLFSPFRRQALTVGVETQPVTTVRRAS